MAEVNLSENHIKILGRVGHVKWSARDGKASRLQISVATKRGQKSAATDWHTIAVWEGQCAVNKESIEVGDVVEVEGSLQYWKSDDGVKHACIIAAVVRVMEVWKPKVGEVAGVSGVVGKKQKKQNSEQDPVIPDGWW